MVVLSLIALALAADAAPVTRHATSADGVDIVYTVQGQGEPALVFIHGGFADRSFWSGQLEAFSRRHLTIALDLGGHGDSGKDRLRWDTPGFGEDVRAVIDKEGLRSAVLIGNSLGGPVAMEAAALRPEVVVAVVGVDTFQNLGQPVPAAWAVQQAAAYRNDYEGTLRKMIRGLFHADVDPALHARVEARMLGPAARAMAAPLMESYASYRWPRIRQPIRSINGDLFPVELAKCREFHRDFDAIVLPHVGHYPMLEDPQLFDRHLERVLANLPAAASPAADEAAIRTAREASNAAFAKRDASAAAAWWTEDYSLVTSRNQQLAGRTTGRDDLAAHFAARPDVVYVRTPRQLGFYAPWGMAWESGDWEGRWTEPGGQVRIGGTYFAKWQKQGEAWRIRAEVFTPTFCTGGASCREPPR